MENTNRGKQYRPALWFVGYFALYMVIVPTIAHHLNVFAEKTFRPLPLFYWNIVSNLILGVFLVILAVKMWSCSPTPVLLVFEGLILVYTFLTLFHGGNNGLWSSAYLPNYPTRTLFLGITTTITVRSLSLYKKR